MRLKTSQRTLAAFLETPKMPKKVDGNGNQTSDAFKEDDRYDSLVPGACSLL